ncbi:MAG: hypothetical protein LBH16_07770 [Treponema sp.]|nr:hypothetical protein [Treponema sp.]
MKWQFIILFTYRLRKTLTAAALSNDALAPGLDIKEIFDQTGAAVSRASERKQIPAIYSQYLIN